MTAQDLKNSILQQAMQGKLVPQDPNDEPASELLKRIKVEKARLIKEGRIRKEKSQPAISKDEIPFDIPESWEWLRLGDIGPWASGATPSKSNNLFHDGGTIPWLVTGDLNDGVIEFIPNKITETALKQTSVKLNPENSVLMAMYGATIGKVGILSFPATTNQACCACQPFHGVDKWYLLYFLISQRTAFRNRGEGGAQPNISKEKIVETLFPLPSLSEQKRIVAKIEELLPLIERYDESDKRLLELNKKFPDDLRKSILQQAVQGKLTEQDPHDEPASELLKRIKAEKARLIKEGKIKKEKPLTPISDDEIPFDIPNSWKWIRLGELSKLITKGTTPRNDYVSSVEKGVGFLRAENVKGLMELDLSNLKYVSREINDGFLKRSIIEEGDLLVTIAGTLGRTALVDADVLPLNANQAISIVRLVNKDYLSLSYLIYSLNCPIIQRKLTDQKKINAIPNLTLEIIRNCVLPLPPLKEQKLIVDRVDELISICDSLT